MAVSQSTGTWGGGAAAVFVSTELSLNKSSLSLVGIRSRFIVVLLLFGARSLVKILQELGAQNLAARCAGQESSKITDGQATLVHRVQTINILFRRNGVRNTMRVNGSVAVQGHLHYDTMYLRILVQVVNLEVIKS